MGIFGTISDTVVEEVDRATNEKNVEEDWGVIINICDKAGKSSEDAKNYLRCILKRLSNPDPHIGVKAVILLDACIKNSGKTFHIEVASREFENEFLKLMTKAVPAVAKKLRESLKKWAENEFKTDGQLTLIPSLYFKLKSEGHDFSSSEEPVKKPRPVNKDPNVVETQEEEDQILKAIELSLKETSGSPRLQAATLYPSVNMTSATSSSSAPAPQKEPRKVRALYDFEAAEDNELTFSTGEIIVVIDDSDPNWWKGSNQRGEGLFPANFVTDDLSVVPENFLYEKAKKMVQFKDGTEEKAVDKSEPEDVEINEEKIDRLLHLLHEADPTNPEYDTEEMLKLEGEVNGMGPLIDAELERVDRKHAQLTQLSADLVDALNLYHTLMREPQLPPANKVNYGYSPVPNSMPYGTLPPNMPSMGMGGPPMGGPMNQDNRSPFMHPGLHNFPSLPSTVSTPGHVPSQGHIPQVQGLPPHLHHQVPDRRNEVAFGGIPNFPPAGMLPPQNFPHNPSHSSIQGGPPQGLPYAVSSTHLLH